MKIIEVVTPQNVILQYELATVRDRIFSFIIDSFIILGLYFLLFFMFGIEQINKAVLISFLAYLIYPFLFEVFLNGQTPGKKAMGIRVVKINSSDITIGDYAIRWLLGFVDIFLTGGCLAAFLVNSSEKGQRIGDIIAHTTVIKAKSRTNLKLADLLNIRNLNDYTPIYSGVTRFNEDEMLLVKNVLHRTKKYKNNAHKKALELLATKIAVLLEVQTPVKDHSLFLNTVLKDYIKLTR